MQKTSSYIIDKPARRKLQTVIEEVELAASIDTIRNLKKLKGFEKNYRIRIGDFRIGLYIDKGTVEFVRILSRKDIYKYFP